MPSDTARDPRVDPSPGDVLKVGKSIRRVTYYPDPAYAEPMVRWTDGISDLHIRIESFRRWAKHAEILKRGEENA